MSLQVMSVVPLEKGKARIRFDDGTEVVLYKGEIRKLGIEEGCVVTEAVYDKILNEILGKRAIKRAMHLLEKQDRTERQRQINKFQIIKAAFAGGSPVSLCYFTSGSVLKISDLQQVRSLHWFMTFLL